MQKVHLVYIWILLVILSVYISDHDHANKPANNTPKEHLILQDAPSFHLLSQYQSDS